MSGLTDDVIANLRTAAALLTGSKRRRFQAEMTLQYCDGSARRAERVFGWGREAVHTGLNELRTGIRCLDACHLRGRKKTEDQCPVLAEQIRRLAEPTAQADPKFQTTLAYTRITAEAVRNALKTQDDVRDHVPCRQTVGRILNRLGYRLRSVLKARPEKRFPRPTPSSPPSTPPATGRRANRTP
jgi:Rhodopirellula transposase DDE domain